MRLVTAAVALVLLLLAACTGRGVVVSGNGIRDNTPEQARAHVIGLIGRDLDATLGAQARAEVVIAGLPRWVESGRRQSEGWYWDQASVEVDLVGDAGTLPALDERVAKDVVIRRLRPSVIGDDLLVRVSALEDPARFARLARRPVSRAAPSSTPVAPTQAGTRRYTVQAGDTWADLSTAFYGSTRHWRIIRDANPGSAEGELCPGQELVIPPRP